jgi:hypothetical protein
MNNTLKTICLGVLAIAMVCTFAYALDFEFFRYIVAAVLVILFAYMIGVFVETIIDGIRKN